MQYKNTKPTPRNTKWAKKTMNTKKYIKEHPHPEKEVRGIGCGQGRVSQLQHASSLSRQVNGKLLNFPSQA
ncbi:hypothetical protein A2647_03795 [Candidatus Nomurabacteria bacterium RIFCSPHIGHO2_01_FULL_40_24b]|uniref:Uncharacterized protein n=1 Tax=Candidatus Nomurabacteria bacterium RIFCSPHIGHO2_01_FULL_40_24b TaxID=1801739 RepID=A0A1F6V7U3_9BACT|nr:MAG: hypothetical protein A2647_03795 [Candidatus Nomurabacteria bacterium RIFCSPHIGHO2_01_FULL_40_24b]